MDCCAKQAMCLLAMSQPQVLQGRCMSGLASHAQLADPINPLLERGTAKDAAGRVDPSNQLPEGLATRVAA